MIQWEFNQPMEWPESATAQQDLMGIQRPPKCGPPQVSKA